MNTEWIYTHGKELGSCFGGFLRFVACDVKICNEAGLLLFPFPALRDVSDGAGHSGGYALLVPKSLTTNPKPEILTIPSLE